MRASRTLTAIAAVAVSVLVVAPTASAYDREAYEYAAGHMIERSDIPKVLGSYAPDLTFNVNPGFANVVCGVPTSVPGAEDKEVKLKKPLLEFAGNYYSPKGTGPSVQVVVLQYSGATAASAAFDALKRDAKQCTGTGSINWTDEEGNTTTYSTAVSNSVVPGVSVVGVDSISVTLNNLTESAPAGSSYVNDAYTVYTLVNDAILQTSYYVNGSKNTTKEQRKATNEVAFNAVSRWLGVS
jgi:hypothetical protein